MSESVVEGNAGDTGVAPAGQGGDQGQTSAEDSAAEATLAGIMQQEDPEELKKQLAHWKSTAQKHERTARDNSSAAKKLRDIEEANKTELQKAIDAQHDAEARAAAVTSQNARMMAAAANDLDPDLIPFLGDGTSEEINERAVQLAAIVDASARKLVEQIQGQNGNGSAALGVRQTRPVESLRPGSAPATNQPVTHDQMFRQLITGQ